MARKIHKPKGKMELVLALEKVLELAEQNILTDNVLYNDELKLEQKNQKLAIARVYELLDVITDY